MQLMGLRINILPYCVVTQDACTILNWKL